MLAGRIHPVRWTLLFALAVGASAGCSDECVCQNGTEQDAAVTNDSGTPTSDSGTDASPTGDDAATTDSGGPISAQGCADGTREGFVDLATYPGIAACAGAWDVPGMVSDASRQPQCSREAGDDGPRPTGVGCSVADLCAAGWHVCESAAETITKATSCDDANNADSFFASRQRSGADLACTAANDTGTNNLHGCGGLGDPEEGAGCSPFSRVMRDSTCSNNAPWSCMDESATDQVYELQVVTKATSFGGGVLCCRD